MSFTEQLYLIVEARTFSANSVTPHMSSKRENDWDNEDVFGQ